MKRPAFWIAFGLASVLAAVIGYRYFPDAFSIVALDITMDRERALADARAIVARDRFGPADYRQAASFELDSETQTFVELEGGGKEAFTRMLRENLHAAYTWRVRQFKEGETNETLIRFTPDGRPYGFVERLKEDAPGAALSAPEARRLAEEAARARWNVDLGRFALAEQGQERRPGGRIDHTFTYERPSPVLNDGRYRLRLVVSGDRLTELTHFVKIPEAFSRRYQNMRSANEAFGVGSLIGMALLYIVGGIGVGLFFLLRKRWVVWRPAAVWGTGVGLLQALALLNSWPLLWMTYDTALPRATFLAQQVATVLAVAIGLSAFFTLSFMAAESLTRRAFGAHPQFWRVWARGPGSSPAILGRTAAGYLLVAMFFAYEVGLYLLATRVLGWWTPSETLLHPDVLATYVPWLTAIANSLQAGFWEECLFRAIPIAGAALIGERLGHRRLFLVIAFVVQAIIFGAGHAPYPTQPSYARPVELIPVSIGFGLLYVYFGLLPAIILHFAFDVVWFALPIFLADAPGIRVHQAMVVLFTLLPLWVVLWRRAQAGTWTQLAGADLNAAWTPPVAVERGVPTQTHPHYSIGRRTRTAWLGLGAASVVAVGALAALDTRADERLPLSRHQAGDIARRALEQRGVRLDSRWRVLPTPDDGISTAHEFIAETAGEQRRQALLDVYLPRANWKVRVATFEGDVAERAEEWQVTVKASGEVGYVRHTLPEGRPGASLDEEAARRLAYEAVARRTKLDAARGDVREVSARPQKLAARTDWTFTFTDITLPPLPQGEPRISVDIAGDEATATGRFIHVPEEWSRKQRASDTIGTIRQITASLVFGGILLAAAVAAVVAWSRRRYAPRLFLAAAAVMLAASLTSLANGWPMLMASLSTAQPLQLQIAALAGVALIGLVIMSVMVGLPYGAQPHRLAISPGLAGADAARLGIAAGLVAMAISAGGAQLRTPTWADAPDVAPLGSVVPFLQMAIDPIGSLLTRIAIVLSTLVAIDRWTLGWSRRRGAATIALVVVGFLGAGAPQGSELGGWIAAGLLAGAGLVAIYTTLLRADLTMIPVALATMTAVAALMRGAERPFPNALPASLAAAIIAALVGWWWFLAIRRATDRVSRPDRASAVVAAP